MKTVLYINNFAGPGLGGGERHLALLATAASQGEWRVVIACLPGSDVGVWLGEQGHKIVDFNPGDPNVLQTIVQLREIITRERVSVVHAHGFLPGNIARAAVRLPATLKLRPLVVTTIHCQPNSIAADGGGAGARLKLNLRRQLDWVTARWGDLFIAVSQDIEDQLIAQGIPGGKVRLIHNGVDIEELQSRALAGVPGNKRVREIGVVARFEAIKGLDDLVRAFGLISGDFPNVRLVLIGGGALGPELRRLAGELNLTDRVEFTGYLNNPLPRMAGFEIYIMPSRSEGLNITLLEAMALGRPVLATDVGGTKELIVEGVTGRLVQSRDPHVLAAALKEMLGAPERAREMGRAGAERAREHFSGAVMTTRTLAAYDELIAIR